MRLPKRRPCQRPCSPLPRPFLQRWGDGEKLRSSMGFHSMSHQVRTCHWSLHVLSHISSSSSYQQSKSSTSVLHNDWGFHTQPFRIMCKWFDHFVTGITSGNSTQLWKMEHDPIDRWFNLPGKNWCLSSSLCRRNREVWTGQSPTVGVLPPVLGPRNGQYSIVKKIIKNTVFFVD